MYDSLLNGKLRQFLAAIIVNLISTSVGISCAWPSPTIPQLRSNHPPIGDSPMSENQVSWIGGLLAIGGLITVPFCGTLSERLGRRNLAFLAGLPFIVSWLLIIFARNYIYVCAARLFAGMAGGMTFFIVPIYIGEIASEDIRGVLGSLLSLSANTGILFAFVTGAILPYQLFASLCLVFPVVFVFTILFLPETPIYLVRRNRQIEAHKSLMFFRGNNLSLVDKELGRLQQQVNDSNSSAKLGIREFFGDRATRRGLIISIGLVAGQQLSGIFAMVSYAETIFERAGSSISAETAPIIIGAIQIIGAYVSTMLMDRAGRRPLMLVSCLGTAVSHALVAGFFYLQQNEHDVSSISWLPVVALSTYVISYVLGMGGVPFVIVSEVFRSNVTSVATTVCCTFLWAMSLATITIFDLAMYYLNADGCFFMLASFCAASLAFTYCALPETKGRTRDDIVDELDAVGKYHRDKIPPSVKQGDGIDNQAC